MTPPRTIPADWRCPFCAGPLVWQEDTVHDVMVMGVDAASNRLLAQGGDPGPFRTTTKPVSVVREVGCAEGHRCGTVVGIDDDQADARFKQWLDKQAENYDRARRAELG